MKMIFVIAADNYEQFKSDHIRLWQTLSVFYELGDFLLDQAILVQAFEFLFLIKIILYQRNKRLENLYYKYNNRTITGRFFKWIAKR